MAILEGRTLARYELQHIIGKGGMADVYVGYDSDLQRYIAVKVFKHEEDEMLQRFIRESDLMSHLHHKNLMPIYNAGIDVVDHNYQYYIVMPFMAGGTLHSRIKRSPLTLNEACRYLYDIASALDYVHAQGIIHRDIKASNVLLDEDGNCYLSDFGIARTTASGVTRLTMTGGLLGTVDYVAPELFEEHSKADVPSDLYALGILLYEMATGQLPFSAENPLAVANMHINKLPPLPHILNPAISPLTEQVMLKALEKRPALRYGSATEFATAFSQSLKASTNSNLWNAHPLLEELAASSHTLSSTTAPPASASLYADTTSSTLDQLTPLRRRSSSVSPRHRIMVVITLAILLVVLGATVWIVNAPPFGSFLP